MKYQDVLAHDSTRDLSTAQAAIQLGWSEPTVTRMRRYFRNLDEKQEEFDATPWFDLIQTAAAAFLTETEYAIAIAEDHRAVRNGWSLNQPAHDRCHECGNKAVSSRGYCMKHRKDLH